MFTPTLFITVLSLSLVLSLPVNEIPSAQLSKIEQEKYDVKALLQDLDKLRQQLKTVESEVQDGLEANEMETKSKFVPLADYNNALNQDSINELNRNFEAINQGLLQNTDTDSRPLDEVNVGDCDPMTLKNLAKPLTIDETIKSQTLLRNVFGDSSDEPNMYMPQSFISADDNWICIYYKYSDGSSYFGILQLEKNNALLQMGENFCKCDEMHTQMEDNSQPADINADNTVNVQNNRLSMWEEWNDNTPELAEQSFNNPVVNAQENRLSMWNNQPLENNMDESNRNNYIMNAQDDDNQPSMWEEWNGLTDNNNDNTPELAEQSFNNPVVNAQENRLSMWNNQPLENNMDESNRNNYIINAQDDNQPSMWEEWNGLTDNNNDNTPGLAEQSFNNLVGLQSNEEEARIPDSNNVPSCNIDPSTLQQFSSLGDSEIAMELRGLSKIGISDDDMYFTDGDWYCFKHETESGSKIFEVINVAFRRVKSAEGENFCKCSVIHDDMINPKAFAFSEWK